ncbi:MAG: MBL fold metallo-hydrolase RNA specificity domain-containing protein, partial [Asgard group archaeon]|nr:MBL fold metallo-hydrolase RNA specificity domain-containing protein [Asgard group archaeon]
GRKILEGERRITLFPWSKNNGYEIDINAEVKQFRFSGHAQRNELIKMLRAINGKKIMFVHGELDSAKSLKEDLTPQKKIIIPENEKTFTHQK